MSPRRILINAAIALVTAAIAVHIVSGQPFTPTWIALALAWATGVISMWTIERRITAARRQEDRQAQRPLIEQFPEFQPTTIVVVDEVAELMGKPHAEATLRGERVAMEPCPDGEHYFPFPEELGCDPESFPGGPDSRGSCACGTAYSPWLANLMANKDTDQ
jgi:hypothetical protein